MKTLAYSVLLISGLIGNQVALSSGPIELESEFDRNEVKWIKEAGNSSVSGEAFLKLKDGTVIAFIIWDVKDEDGASKSGGGVMKRIYVKPNSENRILLIG